MKPIFIFLISIIFLNSCGPGGLDSIFSKAPGLTRQPQVQIPISPQPTPTPLSPQPSQNTSNNIGVLTCEKTPGYEKQFSADVRKFLVGAGVRAEGQEFSCTKKNNGGFWISGKILFERGRFSLANPKALLNIKAGETSYISYDIVNVRNARPLPSSQQGMFLSYGTITNGIFTLTFEDSKGKIFMKNGYVDANGRFIASVSFENKLRNNSGSFIVTQGNLQTFVIEACQFLDCQ